MSHSFPSCRGSSQCPGYTVGRRSSDKNLEQRINIKFCEKIGKSASEMLALLTLAYGEYAVKKLRFLNGMGGSRKGKKMWKMTQEVGSQIHKGQTQMWTVRTLVCSD
jgi:hypothetical protein